MKSISLLPKQEVIKPDNSKQKPIQVNIEFEAERPDHKLRGPPKRRAKNVVSSRPVLEFCSRVFF